MRIFTRSFLFVVLLFVSVTASGQVLQATLTGAQEVFLPGDPDGLGVAVIVVTGTTLTYTITTANLTLPPVLQHIHAGAAGVNGPVVISLGGTWTGGTFSGTVVAALPVVDAILANPAGFYVNVRTTDFPGGAIRGQLAQTSSVPTTSEAVLLLMALGLAIAGALVLKR